MRCGHESAGVSRASFRSSPRAAHANPWHQRKARPPNTRAALPRYRQRLGATPPQKAVWEMTNIEGLNASQKSDKVCVTGDTRMQCGREGAGVPHASFRSSPRAAHASAWHQANRRPSSRPACPVAADAWEPLHPKRLFAG